MSATRSNMNCRAAMTPPERILYRTLILTWVFYAIGALYVVGPVLGWGLAGIAATAIFIEPVMKDEWRGVPPTALFWVWFLSMLGMLVVLWIGHFNYDLGTGKTIKSTIGWAKGWALFFIFIFIGAVFRIRPEVICRGQCIIGLQTLILLPLFILAPKIGLPEKLFVSPFKIVGGPGPEYFSVYLYTIDPSNGASRWQFYTPWSPFAALVGVVMVVCALEERNRFWRRCGLAGGLAIILMTKSRMGLMGLVVCTFSPRLLPLILKSWAWFVMGGLATAMAVFGDRVVTGMGDAVHAFRSARADSTRVRDALQSIASDRWWTEAPWFGHGTVQPGAHVTEYMLIGTHHTWYGLLFVKGAVGAFFFAVPMIWTLVGMMRLTIGRREARLGLGMILALLLFSFGENMEVQIYILWPAFVLLGSLSQYSSARHPHRRSVISGEIGRAVRQGHQ